MIRRLICSAPFGFLATSFLAIAATLTVAPIASAVNLADVRCAMKHSKTMCIARGLVREVDNTAIEAGKRNFLPGDEIFLVSADDQWVRLHPDKAPTEHMDVIQKDGRGMLTITKQAEALESPEDTARAGMSAILDKLGAEPNQMEAPFWPWEANGVIYRICYKTNKKTEECMYSAAANLHSGAVTMVGFVELDEVIAQSALTLIGSVDQPQ